MSKVALAAVEPTQAEPAPPAKRGRKPGVPVAHVDLAAVPVFLLMWQTATANRYAHVVGDAGAEDFGKSKAVEIAKQTALDAKATVIVAGPQFTASAPPVTTVAVEVPVAFG